MKNILITGTSGALGNYLRQYFTNCGYNVIGTVGKSVPRKGEFKIDLGDSSTYTELLEYLKTRKIHTVIHNAASLRGKSGFKKMYAANVVGTENVLHLAKETGCKNFIQISSIGIYGIKSLGKNRDESTKPMDIESYGITKRLAEKKVCNSGISHTILRLPLIKHEGGSLISDPIVKGKSVFIKKRELKIVSTVTPEYVAKVCGWIAADGPLNDTFNCASHHQTWRNMVIDYCQHENIQIKNTKQVSILGAFSMGIVIGPIATFGQHTPSDKLEAIINL